MTTTDVSIKAAPTEQSTDAAVADAKAQQRADARALKDLMRPVATSLTVGRLLAVVSGILAVVPYIALVQIGVVLLDAARDGTERDRKQKG